MPKKRATLCVSSLSPSSTFPIEITFPSLRKRTNGRSPKAEQERIEKALERTVRRLGYEPEWIPLF